MAQYRKKPVVIDAFQVTPEIIMAWLMKELTMPENVFYSSASWNTKDRSFSQFNGYISTLEGDLKFGVGDWIITGVKGEKYACKPDIFEATYEAV